MDYNQTAAHFANVAVELLFSTRYGHLDGDHYAAVFSNNGYTEDEKTRLEVSVFRQFLEEAGVKELGFGLDESGYTWVMMLDTMDGATWAEKARDARFIASGSFRDKGSG